MDIQKILRRTLVAALVLSLGVIAARADIYSATLRGGDLCARCARVVDNPLVAGQIVTPGKFVAEPYRTIACMLTHLQAAGDVPNSSIFVADFRTGKFVPVNQAHFVRVPVEVLSGTSHGHEYGVGPYDYVAFRSSAAATRYAETFNTTPTHWAAVRAAGTAPAVAMAHASH